MNRRIRVPQVRVVGEDGEQIGILSTDEALAMAEARGLDLVEVATNARPPVCRIMDYGKFKYEQSKRAQKAKKKQHVTHLKEVKLRPKTEEHDYQFKLRNAMKFLENRDKVKVTILFRGREMTHLDIGRRILDKFIEDIGDFANLEVPPKREGRTMSLVLSPKSKVKPSEGKSEAKPDMISGESKKSKEPEESREPEGAEKE